MAATSKVLLVDDDPIMRELAQEKLRAADYDVRLAENGIEALAILNEEAIDLVISDLDMPKMNGFALTENIRNHRAISQTPVIVITASDHADAVDKAFAAGASSFLAKPINWTLFNHAVKFVLRASNDQKALTHARDQAEAGAKFKDGLMSVMSHELRTPLNAIIGFGQLLGERFDSENDHLHKEYADYIIDGGKRLLNTVSDMLLASDVQSGPIELSESETTIGELLTSAMAMSADAVRAGQADLTQAVEDAELELYCDRTLLARAISKLIDNAAKFSPKGVKIIVGAAQTAKGDYAILVKDNGPGIPDNIRKRIGSPFVQSDMSLKRSKEGVGLGLPIAQAVARAHNGLVRLDSAPGGGAQAVLIVPKSRLRKPLQSSMQTVA